MQITNHVKRQRTRTPHHLVNPRPLPDDSDQGTEILSRLFQAKLDGLNRIGLVNGVILTFVSFCERHQYVEFVAVRTCGGSAPQGFDAAQSTFIVGLSADWANLHI